MEVISTKPDNLKMLENIKSMRPTDYKLIKHSGETLFVHCALDTIIYSLLSGEKVELETVISKKSVRLKLKPDTNLFVSFIDPSNLDILPNSPDTPSSLCPYLRFFENEEKFQVWRKGLPNGIQNIVTLISIRDAFKLVEQLMNKE